MNQHTDPAPIRGAIGRWIRNRPGAGWMYRGDDLWYTASGDDDTGWTLTAMRYTEQAGRRRSLASDEALYMQLAMGTLDDCHATVAEHRPWLTLAEAFAIAVVSREAQQARQMWNDVATLVDAPERAGPDE